MTRAKPDYGMDAPNVMRNLFLGGLACLLLAIFLPSRPAPRLSLSGRPDFCFWKAASSFCM